MLQRHLFFSTLAGILAFWGSCCPVQAQGYLHFYNDSLHKEVVIRPGDIIKFEYTGYLKQPEAVENKVLQIGDNAIVLGQTAFGYVLPETQRTVMLNDITGFRRFIRSRHTLKAIAQIGTAVGSIILFRSVIDRSKLSGTGDILLTLGVGFGSTILVESLFPKKVKYHVSNGWQYEIR